LNFPGKSGQGTFALGNPHLNPTAVSDFCNKFLIFLVCTIIYDLYKKKYQDLLQKSLGPVGN
jgi:hypothetical protein